MTGKNGAMEALFRSISDDGAEWLFFVGSDAGWKITRDSAPVSIGDGSPASIACGVRRFRALAAVVTNPGGLRCHSTPAAASA